MVAEIGHFPRMQMDLAAGSGTGATLTVLMATRNGAAWLPDQLASLAGQSDRDWRLWVSDDGSTDATRDLVADFARTHPVRLMAGPGRGVAQNFLGLLCHPDLPPGPVAFADQDDVWLPGKLARARSALAAVPQGQPALYGAASLAVDAALRPLGRIGAPQPRPSFGGALVQNLFSGHTMVLNAPAVALARRAGVPEGVAYHDWWLYQLIAGAGGALILDAEAVALYRQHGDNVLGARRGPGAALARARRLASGDWRATMRLHADALAVRGTHLTPEARALVAEYLGGFARFGLARAAAFRRHGLTRATARDRALMLFFACLGRV